MKTAQILLVLLVFTLSGSVSISQTKSEVSKVRSSGRTYSQEADLSNKDLNFIPEDIFASKHLRILDLRDNNITSLPAEIENLKNLRVLDLRGNEIYELPEELSKLKFLKEIHLDYDYWHSNLDDVKKLTRARIVLNKE